MTRLAAVGAALFTVAVVARGSGAAATAVSLGQEAELLGRLHVIWTDRPVNGRLETGPPELVLITDSGEWVTLKVEADRIGRLGGLSSVNGRRVRLSGQWQGFADALVASSSHHAFEVSSVGFDTFAGAPSMEHDSAVAVTGSIPWLVLLCRVPESPIVYPSPVPHYTTMLGADYPGLDHYWRELSFDNIDLIGSQVAGWFDLPGTAADYWTVSGSNSFMNLAKVSNDCTAAADATVDFRAYAGLAFVVPAPPSTPLPAFQGGSITMSLDGETKAFRAVWIPHEIGCGPVEACSSISIVAHEMGHSLGLPHSSGPYGETYDSSWDVMSGKAKVTSAVARCDDPIWYCIGQHTIAYHKDLLGWIPPERVFTAPTGSSTVTLESLDSVAVDAGTYMFARVPVPGTARFYTVEARRFVGYDSRVPGEAIVIHQVDPGRASHAWVMDGQNTDPTETPNDAEARWLPGEIFYDLSGEGLLIEVGAATARGWSVTITRGSHGSFAKASPGDESTVHPLSAGINWLPVAGATGYEYCIDTTDNDQCDTIWRANGAATSAFPVTTSLDPTGLAASTTYYWQVRAQVGGSTVYANGGADAFWGFSTAAQPVVHPKFSPVDGAAGLGLNPTLVWQGSNATTRNEYCVDTIDNAACDTGWVSTGASSLTTLNRLSPNTTYYWQIRAVGTTSTIYGNGSARAYWRFTTGSQTVDIRKSVPPDGATGLASSVALEWTVGDLATNEICLDTVDNGICDTGWQNTGSSTSVTAGGLSPATSYYWQVRAIAGGSTSYGDGSALAFWKFTTVGATSAPAAPTDLVASFVVGNLVTFRWTPSSTGPAPTGYVIEGGMGPGTVLARIETGNTAPIFTVAIPPGSFYVRARATIGALVSAPSNEIQINVNQPILPSSPADLLPSVNGSTLTLAWRNTFTGGQPVSHLLEVSGSHSGTIPLALGERATFHGVPPGTYSVSVRARNAFGVSTASNGITVSVPSACSGTPHAPRNFLAYKVGSTIHVVWDPPADGPAHSNYVLDVSGSFIGSIPTSERSLRGTVGPGAYSLAVAAVNECGVGPAAAPQTVTVP